MALRAEIISPEKRCVDRDVDMVVVPGTEGDIAAMPGRAPVMLQLRGGIVRFYQNGQVLERFFVSGGFVDMVSDCCTVLADSVRALDELSREDAEERLRALKAELAALGASDALMRDSLNLKIRSVCEEIQVIDSL